MTESEVWAYPAEYGAAASAWMNDAVDTLSREIHPLLASIRRERVADLPRPEEHAPETAQLASPLFRGIKTEQIVRIDAQDALSGDVDSFLTMTFQLADALGSQFMDGFLSHISEVSEAYDQTLDAKGRDIIDVIIDSLETLDISFNENGEHNLTMVLHPDTAEKLQNTKLTTKKKARLQQVLQRRREEWNASRRRHDLP